MDRLLPGCCQGNNTLQRGKITHCFSFLWHWKWAEVLAVVSICQLGIFHQQNQGKIYLSDHSVVASFLQAFFPYIYTSIKHKGHGDHGFIFSYKWLVVNLLLTWKLLLAKSWTHFPLVSMPWLSDCYGLGWSFTHRFLARAQANVRNECTS